MEKVLIVITNPSVASKCNAYANDGFLFCTIGYTFTGDDKYDIIIITCHTHPEASKAWAKDLIDNHLKTGGLVCGFTPEPKPEVEEPKTEDKKSTFDYRGSRKRKRGKRSY